MKTSLNVYGHLDPRQFEITVRKLADHISYGMDSSVFVGAGIEYVQSRPYVEGDPAKFIDWRVTARTRRTHVKEYEALKRLPVIIVVDTSASMCLGIGEVNKYTWAVQLAGALALASLARISPVGLIGCGDRPIRYEPSLGRSQIFQWLHELRAYDLNEKTRLGARLRELVGLLKNRSIVLVLSDMHDPDALPALKLLAHQHDCVALQLQDPSEVDLACGGFFCASEAETKKTFVGHGRASWLKSEGLARGLAHAGIDHLVIRIDQPVVPVVRNFMRRRANFWRGTR